MTLSPLAATTVAPVLAYPPVFPLGIGHDLSSAIGSEVSRYCSPYAVSLTSKDWRPSDSPLRKSSTVGVLAFTQTSISSHNPPSKQVIEVASEKGIIVAEEA